MSNCEIVDHQKVCRVTVTQIVLRDRKKVCAPRFNEIIDVLKYWRILPIFSNRSLKFSFSLLVEKTKGHRIATMAARSY